MIYFSGMAWYVRDSPVRSNPGPNLYSDSPKNVWVDSDGRLHLKITRRGRNWYCAEVIAADSLGYGTYRFYLDSAVGAFDPKVVAGFFTWNDDPAYNNRELDIEFSRWGRAADPNAQFVVQPYDGENNILHFVQPSVAQSTHTFVWQPNAVDFSSVHGADVIAQWSAYEGIPIPGGETPHINLWLYEGKAPVNRSEVELIVNRFEFIPD